MIIRLFYLVLCLFCQSMLNAQVKTDSLLATLLLDSKSELVREITRKKDEFRLQVIYTQINRDARNLPSFRNYYFNVDTNVYFNPASTVKLPLALLALEKLNDLKRYGINKNS